MLTKHRSAARLIKAWLARHMPDGRNRIGYPDFYRHLHKTSCSNRSLPSRCSGTTDARISYR